MTIEDFISIATSRLIYLASQRETAVRIGDSVQIAAIDKETAETQTTLNVLSGVAQ